MIQIVTPRHCGRAKLDLGVRVGLDWPPKWVYNGITLENGEMSKANARGGSNASETRISVRVKAAQKALITRAARLRQTTLTEFVLDNALRAATQLLAEEKHFEMTPKQFRRFCRALDNPPAKNLLAMRRLLNEPGVLDG